MNVTVPHDHPCTIVLTDKASGREVHRETTTAEVLGGAYTRIRITWNALAVSGGTRWVHPGTGEWYSHGLTIRVETTHPDTGEPMEVNLR